VTNSHLPPLKFSEITHYNMHIIIKFWCKCNMEQTPSLPSVINSRPITEGDLRSESSLNQISTNNTFIISKLPPIERSKRKEESLRISVLTF
jgi:hypothetical protein